MHHSPSLMARVPIVNAMTVDVEDYFHVSAFEGLLRWNECESRVTANTERLLELFSRTGLRATFFVLGWVAERYPVLVRRIADCGHELASHGYGHRLVYDQTPREFRDDVRRAKAAIEQAGSRQVLGYRAPSYSITNRSLWAVPILLEEGYRYDSSVFPIYHDRYGIPGARRHAHFLRGSQGALMELPPATARYGPVNIPVAGGAYFRLLPYCWTKWGLQRENQVARRPVVFYLHPWELDADQPRVRVSWQRRLRHYHNLAKTGARLERLLHDFRFDSIASVYSITASPVAKAS